VLKWEDHSLAGEEVCSFQAAAAYYLGERVEASSALAA
jgi:hypothetical protein